MCLFLVPVCASALPTLIWGPTNFGTFMQASALGTVSLYSTTSTGGVIDIAVRNTSPLYHSGSTYANAYITALDFNIPTGFTFDTKNSSVKAGGATALFSNGVGNQVVTSTLERILNWSYATHSKTYEVTAANKSNKSTIWSLNAVVGGIPQDTMETKLLKTAYNYAVFGTVHYYIAVKGGSRPLAESDLNMYNVKGNLTLFWQGGGSSTSNRNTAIPEPSTWLLLVGGAMAVGAGIIRRKLYK